MTETSEILKDHFLHPRREGELENPDGVGIVGNARCGDILSFQIKVEADKLAQIRFQCLGCGAAKAVASYLAELAEGKPVAELEKIRLEDVFKELRGLPKNKWHCPFQALDALKMAVADWQGKEHEGKRKMIDVEPIPSEMRCPYCQELLGENAELCENCRHKEITCKNCGENISPKKERR